jgi:ABC-type branched-subunit amino acid transport system substrate-binding protein
MNWEAIGAMGQAVSALALVLVLVQVSYARGEMRRAARQSRADTSRELWLAQANDNGLSHAMETLWMSSNERMPFVAYAMACGLSAAEARQVLAYAWAGWQSFQAAIESAGHLSDGARDELNRNLRENYSGNTFHAKWYELMKWRLNPDAVRYIDRVLATPL